MVRTSTATDSTYRSTTRGQKLSSASTSSCRRGGMKPIHAHSSTAARALINIPMLSYSHRSPSRLANEAHFFPLHNRGVAWVVCTTILRTALANRPPLPKMIASSISPVRAVCATSNSRQSLSSWTNARMPKCSWTARKRRASASACKVLEAKGQEHRSLRQR
jgi:hypothetical protein